MASSERSASWPFSAASSRPKAAAARLPDGSLFVNAGRLTLAALLLATVGGFGSLFNLLVSPEIRAYNRVTPFICVSSRLVAIALIADTAPGRRRGRRRSGDGCRRALVAALLIGLYDDAQVAVPLNRGHEDIRQEWTALGSVRPLARGAASRRRDGIPAAGPDLSERDSAVRRCCRSITSSPISRRRGSTGAIRRCRIRSSAGSSRWAGCRRPFSRRRSLRRASTRC